MKNYTLYFLIATVITALLGYTGLEYPGDKIVRIICLFAGVALFISCLDAVIVSRKKRSIKQTSE